MNAEEAFLQSVLDDPLSDTPRLVFADWLEDHDQPARAAFIRAQCRLVTLDEDDPARLALRRDESAYLPRARELLGEKGPGRLPAWVLREHLVFERGFPARLQTTANRFVKGADALMRAAPIQHLTLGNAIHCPEALAACSYLARIRSLDLPRGGLSGEEMEVLAASRQLAGLTRLGLRENRAGIEGGTVLADSATLAGLRSLDLAGNLLFDRGTEALAASKYLTRLESLDLGHCLVGPRGVVALAGSSNLTGLHELNLAINRIGDRGAETLARSPHLEKLVRLNVSANHLTKAGARALLTSTALTSLARLDLTRAALDDTFWTIVPAPQMSGRLHLTVSDVRTPTPALMESPLLARCAGLTLLGGRGGLLDVGLLARSPVLANLRELGLTVSLGLEAIRALARSPHLGRLRRLSRAGVYLSLPETTALLEAPWLAQLTHLALNVGARVGLLDELARCPALENILELRLVNTGYIHSFVNRHPLLERFGTRVVLA